MTPGILIEGLVIVLLSATIVYCYILCTILKRLKLEESELRSTIAELLTATELAARAIQGLKITAHENQKNLGLRMRDAERMNVELRNKLDEGEVLMQKLVAITQAANTLPPQRRPQPAHRPATTSQPRAVSELAAEATARINAFRNAQG